jgi:DNA-binding IclR family transcriptional regulator
MTNLASSLRDDGARVPAVERAVRLIDLLASAHEPLALADLTRQLALPKSSVHGLLGTLVALGLARRNDAGEFTLGTRPLQWADAYAAQSDILRAFDTHARQITALTTETVMLAVLEGADVLYLACQPGTRPLAVNFRVGGRFPAAFTSSGKAMMTTLPEATVRAMLAGQPFTRPTRHSVASVAALLRQLAQVREQGWATDDEETAEGMQCFGAPVFGPRHTTAVAAVAVSVIKAGLTQRRRQSLIAGVQALAQALSQSLGARPARQANAVTSAA